MLLTLTVKWDTKTLAFIAILLSTVLIADCTKSATNNNDNVARVTENAKPSSNGNNKTVNQNIASPTPGSSSTETNTNSPTQAARQNRGAVLTRDLDLYKKTLSREELKEMKKLADLDHKSLDDEIRAYFDGIAKITDDKSSKGIELRNEIIKGNTATVEQKVVDFWMVRKFIKEDGVWKCDGVAGSVKEYHEKHLDYKVNP
jgi:hypothetical protein